MHSQLKRATNTAFRRLGIRRRIRPARIRPEDPDLQIFREMSKISRRITGEEVDDLIRLA